MTARLVLRRARNQGVIMADQHQYSVDVTRDGFLATGDAHSDRRARIVILRSTERRFVEERAAWAASDTGRLRTRVAIRFEIALELALLCQLLGSWAHVEGNEIFPERLQLEGDGPRYRPT